MYFNIPPPGNPRAFEFLENFCSNSPLIRQAQSGIRAKNYSWSTIHSVSKIRQCARFTAKIHNPCDFWGQIRRIQKSIHPPHQSLTSPPSPPWLINPLNPRGISSTRYMKSRLAIKFPTPMSGDQIPSLPGRKRRPMPGVCPVLGGGGDVETSIWLVHNSINTVVSNWSNTKMPHSVQISNFHWCSFNFFTVEKNTPKTLPWLRLGNFFLYQLL